VCGDGPILTDLFDYAVIWTGQEGDESFLSLGWQQDDHCS
jgi:hypothetical protein